MDLIRILNEDCIRNKLSRTPEAVFFQLYRFLPPGWKIDKVI